MFSTVLNIRWQHRSGDETKPSYGGRVNASTVTPLSRIAGRDERRRRPLTDGPDRRNGVDLFEAGHRCTGDASSASEVDRAFDRIEELIAKAARCFGRNETPNLAIRTGNCCASVRTSWSARDSSGSSTRVSPHARSSTSTRRPARKTKHCDPKHPVRMRPRQVAQPNCRKGPSRKLQRSRFVPAEPARRPAEGSISPTSSGRT